MRHVKRILPPLSRDDLVLLSLGLGAWESILRDSRLKAKAKKDTAGVADCERQIAQTRNLNARMSRLRRRLMMS